MSWLAQFRVEKMLEATKGLDSLVQLFAVSQFLDAAFFPTGFELRDPWEAAVVFSPEGSGLVSRMRDVGILESPRTAAFVMLMRLFWRDLLVDHEATNYAKVLTYLRNLHGTYGVRWPYIFGRTLYDKFNATYEGDRVEVLPAQRGQGLLDGTPQGVFQVGRLLSGPLGFLESLESRVVLPTLRLPLWHCSDPGCQSLHLVRLGIFKGAIAVEEEKAERFLSEAQGQPSEFMRPLMRAARGSVQHKNRTYADIASLLAECVIGDERGGLLETILNTTSGPSMRAVIGAAKGLRGKAEQIVGALGPEEQHQLILLCRDREIIQALDGMIADRSISIPPSEVRKVETVAFTMGNDRDTEISSLGTKSVPDGCPPMIHLFALIWQAYERLGMLDELEWRVRHIQGSSSTAKHSLMEFLRKSGPQAAIKELILSSRAITTEIGGRLWFEALKGEDQVTTCRRLMWKFGFQVPRYGDEYHILRNRIGEFKAAVVQMPQKPTEDDRARIRSIGVNMFVSIEALFEDILAFNVWMLASDHFMETKFKFTKEDALRKVAETLGAEIDSGEETLQWHVDGSNTLGTLLGYLAAYRKWLKGRLTANRDAVERPSADYPFYAHDDLWLFPYVHTQLWADVPHEALARYLTYVESVCGQAVQAELTKVRNGLDHKRDEADFPEPDKMLACVSRLEELTDVADRSGLLPKLFWSESKEQKLDSISIRVAKDYKGSSYTMEGPSPIGPRGDNLPDLGTPYILAPADFLGIPNSDLYFIPAPMTNYRRYWSDYPLRKGHTDEPKIEVSID